MWATSRLVLEVLCTQLPSRCIPVCRLTPRDSPSPDTYIIISAYSITSAYISSGQCTTSSGNAITLQTPFSLTKPSATDSALFQVVAETSFINFLGFSSCSGSGQKIVPTALVSATPYKITATASALGNTASSMNITSSTSKSLITPHSTGIISTPSSSSIPTSKPNQQTIKILAGVAVPLGSIAISALGISLWRIYRQRRHAKTVNQNLPNQTDSPAFLQRKAELEAEERQRSELHGEDVRHELVTRESRSELHGGARWQELRGEEHSRELEAST